MSSVVICPGCKQRINVSPAMVAANIACPMCKSPLDLEPVASDSAPSPPGPVPGPPASPPPQPEFDQPPISMGGPSSPSQMPAPQHPTFSVDQDTGSSPLIWIMGLLGCGGLMFLVASLVIVLMLNRTVDPEPADPPNIENAAGELQEPKD